MTAPLFSGRARRSVAALGAVSAGLLLLSACDKPTPLATVTVGTSSVSTEAACSDAKELTADKVQECFADLKHAKNIDYGRGDTLRLGVEPDVVEDGKKWQAVLDGQPITEPSSNTYRSFPGADLFATGGQGEAPASKKLNIVQVSEDGKPIAVWAFNVKLK
ncbi:DUF2771 domain-containing protein [Streptomyces sp. ZAF1911]|uniref:DUF2771 domain-containing protein n=1 Tax=Streptomyces TaxID=1883 RepID=UPI00202F0291|nr:MULTISPECIES: DUF2771 domain-containing protein [unclassified Streptomyces]MCM1973272.1 DUF2771 domain-containing protein [Streptomyces sp. G1]MCX5124374.1 DUF2771 domain-containing protein [Streptomyces sp. NBC_00347]MCX5297621.1 DUF2771 domain-containing protein [Streptomyces sp. NBC_00193]MDD9377145.1 DUF2771 domain-containing protein [Streptomyces sp. ZAF1911]